MGEFMYNQDNIFAKIIRGEIPARLVVENEYAISFCFVIPVCENHVLIVPRGEYENILDFVRRASVDEQAGFWDCFSKTADKLGIDSGFNIFANAGENAPMFKQTVFHFHLHLIAGSKTPEYHNMVKHLECEK